MWLTRKFPTVSFERYADDAVIHRVSKAQAEQVLAALTHRMAQVGLHLHPNKTRIVYCKDDARLATTSTSGSPSWDTRFARGCP